MYKPTARFQYVDISMEELNTPYHAMPQRFAVVVYPSGVMGLRPGEVYGLQRRDVRLKDDLSGGVLDIVRAAKEYSPKDPETGKRHKKVLVNETKKHWKRQTSPIPGVHLQGAGSAPSHIRAGRSDRVSVHGAKDVRGGQRPDGTQRLVQGTQKAFRRLEEKKVSPTTCVIVPSAI